MVARFTRILLAVQLCAAAGIYLLLVRAAGYVNHWLAAVLAVAIVLLVRMAITANNFGLAWVYRSVTPLHHRLGRLAAARLFLIEYGASMMTSSWTMGFCTFRDRPGPAGTPPVLLVHGYGCAVCCPAMDGTDRRMVGNPFQSLPLDGEPAQYPAPAAFHPAAMPAVLAPGPAHVTLTPAWDPAPAPTGWRVSLPAAPAGACPGPRGRFH